HVPLPWDISCILRGHSCVPYPRRDQNSGPLSGKGDRTKKRVARIVLTPARHPSDNSHTMRALHDRPTAGRTCAGGIMVEPQTSKLRQVIEDTAALLRRFHGRSLGEQNTKASLIEPVLQALGWAIRDADEVHREYKPQPKDNPVDYALTLLRKPRLF